MAGCGAFTAGGDFGGALLAYVDCRTLAVAQGGWQALGPGSGWGEVLTGLLTLVVAVQGYRLLLGDGLGLREWVLVTGRIGLVLALATQWPAWSVLVFDVVTGGPERIAAGMLAPLGEANGAALASRVQRVNGAIAALTDPPSDKTNGPSPRLRAFMPQAQPIRVILLPESRRALDTAGGTFALACLGSMVTVHVTLAVLLALGPIFVTLLLFTTTQGAFIGWARAMTGVTLGAAVVPVVIAMALGVMEPQLAELHRRIDTGAALEGLTQDMRATALVFAAAMAVALAGVVKAAAGLAVPHSGRSRSAAPRSVITHGILPPPAMPMPTTALPRLNRATTVADAVQALTRREAALAARATPTAPGRDAMLADATAAAMRPEITAPVPRLGQVGKRSNRRHSAQASHRDGR